MTDGLTNKGILAHILTEHFLSLHEYRNNSLLVVRNSSPPPSPAYRDWSPIWSDYHSLASHHQIKPAKAAWFWLFWEKTKFMCKHLAHYQIQLPPYKGGWWKGKCPLCVEWYGWKSIDGGDSGKIHVEHLQLITINSCSGLFIAISKDCRICPIQSFDAVQEEKIYILLFGTGLAYKLLTCT